MPLGKRGLASHAADIHATKSKFAAVLGAVWGDEVSARLRA